MNGDEAAQWLGAVEVLAAWPQVVARLAAEHVADVHGRCCGGTRPGAGTPAAWWPCRLALLARDAAKPSPPAAPGPSPTTPTTP